MGAWLRARIAAPLLELLRQGTSAQELALSLALGLGVGIFPVLGVSTPALAVIAIAMRLNLPAVQLVNYLAYPLQLLLIIPFLRVGERIAGAAPQPLTIEAALDILADGTAGAIVILWDAIVHASIGWFAIVPILILVLYRVSAPLLARAAARMHRSRAAAG